MLISDKSSSPRNEQPLEASGVDGSRAFFEGPNVCQPGPACLLGFVPLLAAAVSAAATAATGGVVGAAAAVRDDGAEIAEKLSRLSGRLFRLRKRRGDFFCVARPLRI